METTFIYELYNPITNLPFYIGKSDIPFVRSEKGHFKEEGNNHKINTIKQIIHTGLKPVVNIVDEVKESEWKFWEKHYISLYKSWGFNLTNILDGVEGFSKGNIPWHKGKKGVTIPWNKGVKGCFTKQTIKLMSDAKLNVKRSEKAKLAVSIGINNSEKFRIAMASEEVKNKKSISSKKSGKIKRLHNTKEWKNSHSKKLTGRKSKQDICIHCKKEFALCIIAKFHNQYCFDNPSINVEEEKLRRKRQPYRKHKKYKQQQLFKCNYCPIIATASKIVRWHNENCKHKKLC